MTKKWIAINLLMLVITALLGWQLREAIFQFRAQNNLAKIQPAPDLKKKMLSEKQAPKAVSAAKINAAEFAIIPEKNLFSDTRSKEEIVVNLAPPEPPPLAVKPILVGITIMDTERKASIIEPGGAPGLNERGRRAQFKKIGDVYQGYTITEIQPDRIVLTSGTRREVIPLREGSKKASGGKTAILSTRVVPIGQGGIVGGTPMSVGGAAIAAPPRTSVTQIGTTSPAANQPAAQTVSPARATPAAQPAAAPSAPAGDPGASRIIRTPFGDVVRPVR